MFNPTPADTVTDLSSQALSNLLTQFTAAFKQTDRLLRLHTPLGANVLLAHTFKAIESVSGISQIRPGDVAAQNSMGAGATGYFLQIDALSTNAHLELKSLIGQPVLLELLTDQSRTELRPFHGHVSGVQCLGSNGGMAKYRLTVEPWLAFLRINRDSAVFQDQTVLQIVETVFTDYQSSLRGSGQLNPLWRLHIQDPSVYPVRSLTTQYQESDLAFIERLLLEEGLFYWFEHSGDAASPSLGSHTLVIADHNNAFAPHVFAHHAGATVRFSQSKGTIKDDTIDQWRPQRQWRPNAVELSSWDYRTLSNRLVAEHSPYAPAGTPALVMQDTPGAYAYESVAQGQRLARQHLQALDVQGHAFSAGGTVRAFKPARTFSLSGHANAGLADTPHVVLSVLHHAKNNLPDSLHAFSQTLSQTLSQALNDATRSVIDKIASRAIPGFERPALVDSLARQRPADVFYRNAALVLPLSVPYRGSGLDGHGRLIHPKPTASGSQTALVIGVEGQPLTTERDHRVKVQFAWQRGARSQSRLSHPAPEGHSGAPAADGSSGAGSTTGTWVRVATPLAPIAGLNWGSVALPRVGQEVLVTFLNGDIDRPVIVGSLYNGQGQDNEQSNQVGAGAANATANAPSWFAGSQPVSGQSGTLPGHAHNAVLSGIKTQALSTSQTGMGGYNQIVFDDSPGQSRLSLQSHSAQSGNHAGEVELNLGALRQQTDNQRLSPVGYGFELKTHFSGAIRSGSGLLLTADKRPGNESGSASPQMDSKEAQAQLQSGHDLINSLSNTAQQHQAMLPVLKTTEAKPEKMPVSQQLAHIRKAMTGGEGAGAGADYSEPLLVMSAPAGIALLTPQTASFSAGTTTSLAAGQDIQLLAQANAAHSVKAGISLFTYGKASNPQKPNHETGISLHAASGKVSSQSQSDKTQITADKAIKVTSTTNAVTIQAPKHVLLTAQGAYIKLSGGDIEVHAPGMVDFKATAKSLTGPRSDSIAPLSLVNGPLRIQNWIGLEYLEPETGDGIADVPYEIHFKDGNQIKGTLNAEGQAEHRGINPQRVEKVVYKSRPDKPDTSHPSHEDVFT